MSKKKKKQNALLFPPKTEFARFTDPDTFQFDPDAAKAEPGDDTFFQAFDAKPGPDDFDRF